MFEGWPPAIPPERRAHSKVPPSSLIPVRFEFGFTDQEREKSICISGSVRKSGADWGPRIALISHSRAYSGGAANGRGPPQYEPTGSRSPATSARPSWPPSAPIVYVAREPSTVGT